MIEGHWECEGEDEIWSPCGRDRPECDAIGPNPGHRFVSTLPWVPTAPPPSPGKWQKIPPGENWHDCQCNIGIACIYAGHPTRHRFVAEGIPFEYKEKPEVTRAMEVAKQLLEKLAKSNLPADPCPRCYTGDYETQHTCKERQ